jgi:hypothetical protein
MLFGHFHSIGRYRLTSLNDYYKATKKILQQAYVKFQNFPEIITTREEGHNLILC